MSRWALLLVAVVVTALFAVSQSPSWLFKGAYFEYYGETYVQGVPVKVEMRIEIVDIRGSLAKALFYMRATTPLGSFENQSTIWFDLSKTTYEIEGYTLKRYYEDHVYVRGFGTRECVIFEYSAKDGQGGVIFYIDKATVVPIKIGFTGGSPPIALDLSLVGTNVPGLGVQVPATVTTTVTVPMTVTVMRTHTERVTATVTITQTVTRTHTVVYTTTAATPYAAMTATIPLAVIAAVAVVSALLIYKSRRAPRAVLAAARRPREAYLILPDGSYTKLVGDVLLGRAWLASIFPDAPWLEYISEGHAVIRRRPDGWYIADLGSQYGTFVNGVDIRGAGEVKLESGYAISLGTAFTMFFSEEPPYW